MVLVIAFLTVTNIALGYGLAIYVNRHFGTLLLSRSKSPAAAQQKTAEPPPVEKLAEDLPTLAPTAVSVIAEQAATKPAASEPVDEENVLAGIEEFRSQLAKMNTAVDQSPVDASAPEVELAAAN
ncbi:MAG: hypothetical protein SH868_04060 [Bythopirellula sp.]|nr:hypothetical protein [Bythopirellula sp.]